MPSKIHFLDPSSLQMTTLWFTFLALIALCPDRFLIFRLRSPFRILLLAAVPCTFRLQGLFCNNACLQHTWNFPFFCASSVFFLYFCALTLLLFAFLFNCLIKGSPPSVGSMILKVAGKRYLQKMHFRHPNSSEKVPYWGYLWHIIEICKNRGKSVYFCFAALVGKLSFAFCALSPTFWKFFQIFA